jgi:hypothetical protein
MNIRKPVSSSHTPLDFEASQAARYAPLSRDILVELFEYVEEGLAVTGCDHSFRCSETFLVANGAPVRLTLAWLRRHGARCDCEALEEFEHGGAKTMQCAG